MPGEPAEYAMLRVATDAFGLPTAQGASARVGHSTKDGQAPRRKSQTDHTEDEERGAPDHPDPIFLDIRVEERVPPLDIGLKRMRDRPGGQFHTQEDRKDRNEG